MPVKYFILLTFLLLFPSAAALSETPPGAASQKLYPLFEENYLAGLNAPYEEASAAMDSLLARGETLLLSIERSALSILPEKLDELAFVQVKICGRASAERRFATKALNFVYKARRRIFRLSGKWPRDNVILKDAFRRALVVGRLASEELPGRLAGLMISPIHMLEEVPSQTPSATVQGIEVHSGDILLSGGGGLVPLLIARGTVRPGRYSRSAIIYVDEATAHAWVLTSFPFAGTVKLSLTEYLKRADYNALLLRPSPRNERLQADPLLPHKAALSVFNKIEPPRPYDYMMDWNEGAYLFPEEMIFAAYESAGIRLWPERGTYKLAALKRWLSLLGVSNFDLMPPSELEYDLNFVPVIEWFNMGGLQEQRFTFAVIDTLLHSAHMGAEPGYAYDELPLALLAKTWSLVDTYRGRRPSVPAGLSPFEALRIKTLDEKVIPLIREDLRRTAYWFKEEKGREPNFYELQMMAEKVLQKRRGDLEGLFKTYEAETPDHLK